MLDARFSHLGLYFCQSS